MKIVASADWRDRIPFETPMIVADLVPGEPARCASCPPDSEPLVRTELWAVKHQHPKHHGGHVRFYCAAHTPVIERAPEPVARAAARPAARRERSAPERTTAPRRTVDERPRAVCPDCFVEVPSSGVCGMCGNTVA